MGHFYLEIKGTSQLTRVSKISENVMEHFNFNTKSRKKPLLFNIFKKVINNKVAFNISTSGLRYKAGLFP